MGRPVSADALSSDERKDFTYTLGYFVRKMRMDAGLTMGQFSELLRVHPATISNIEHGYRELNLFEFIFIAERLQRDPLQATLALLKDWREAQERRKIAEPHAI